LQVFKLNLLLMAVLMLCAFSVITSQHKARRLYVELQREQKLSKLSGEAFDQLLLEQSAQGMHSRIEAVAANQLKMKTPDPKVVKVVTAAGVPVELPKETEVP
jgi:cell division protein FtsL